MQNLKNKPQQKDVLPNVESIVTPSHNKAIDWTNYGKKAFSLDNESVKKRGQAMANALFALRHAWLNCDVTIETKETNYKLELCKAVKNLSNSGLVKGYKAALVLAISKTVFDCDLPSKSNITMLNGILGFIVPFCEKVSLDDISLNNRGELCVPKEVLAFPPNPDAPENVLKNWHIEKKLSMALNGTKNQTYNDLRKVLTPKVTRFGKPKSEDNEAGQGFIKSMTFVDKTLNDILTSQESDVAFSSQTIENLKKLDAKLQAVLTLYAKE